MKKLVISWMLTVLILLIGFQSLTAQEKWDMVNFKNHSFIPGYGVKKLSNTAIFQGNTKKKNYFEGWYFKMVSTDGASLLSVIPGISLSQDGKELHAFIQLIDGRTAKTSYYSYPIDSFYFSPKEFAVRIADNYFSADSIVLNIQHDTAAFIGKVFMKDRVPLSLNAKKHKGIMGWYRFVPFMQCYHGVVSLTHQLNGTIKSKTQAYNFDNGRGYIEKDWGESMPSSWIWMQSNHFSTHETSFMLSVATIPWMGSSFNGFLGFLLYNGTLHRFATYTHADLQIEHTNADTLSITITDKQFTYRIITYRSNSGMLKAPVQGSMDRRIAESIDATLKVSVWDKDSKLVFRDSTSVAGLEIVGNMDVLSDAATTK